MAARKLAPGLAVGNSVVLKPAEQSALLTDLSAQLFLEGALNTQAARHPHRRGRRRQLLERSRDSVR